LFEVVDIEPEKPIPTDDEWWANLEKLDLVERSYDGTLHEILAENES
jgi:hypothetical protein